MVVLQKTDLAVNEKAAEPCLEKIHSMRAPGTSRSSIMMQDKWIRVILEDFPLKP